MSSRKKNFPGSVLSSGKTPVKTLNHLECNEMKQSPIHVQSEMMLSFVVNLVLLCLLASDAAVLAAEFTGHVFL